LKHFIVLIIFLLIGCQTSVERSFHDLNEAFINWYFKFHPVEASRYGISDHHGLFRMIGSEQNEEHVADISRFIIELSQIDPTKLSTEDRINYEILVSKLEEMKYFMEKIKPWEWNPSWVLKEIYDGLFLISESQNIKMIDRVNAVKNRLSLIPKYLESSKSSLNLFSEIHFKEAKNILEGIMKLLDDMPIKLNSDNLTLDEIDLLIISGKKALVKHGKWLSNGSSNFSKIEFPIYLDLFNAFPLLVDKKYFFEKVYKLAHKKIVPIQNKLFEKSLPIYLMENDEPVWLDRDDTLEVIHWSIDYIYNKPENQVSNSGILAHFFDSMSKMEKFINSKNIMNVNNKKRIKLALYPGYLPLKDEVELFGHHQKVNSEIIYFIMNHGQSEGLFPLIKQEIDILNAKNINPGRMVQMSYSQKRPMSIRYLFPDLINQKGWELYSSRILMDLGYFPSDNFHLILLLKEELKTSCVGYIEGQYYTGKITRQKAISYLKNESFLTDKEADKMMKEMELKLFSGTYSFIGMLEMNSLQKEYEKKIGNFDDNYALYDFHQKILEQGMIPFNHLKKEILSP